MIPLIWAGVGIAGLVATGWAAKEGEQAIEASARLMKWGAVAGGVYVSYRALKASGVLK